jgi:hypothetical protein
VIDCLKKIQLRPVVFRTVTVEKLGNFKKIVRDLLQTLKDAEVRRKFDQKPATVPFCANLLYVNSVQNSHFEFLDNSKKTCALLCQLFFELFWRY